MFFTYVYAISCYLLSSSQLLGCVYFVYMVRTKWYTNDEDDSHLSVDIREALKQTCKNLWLQRDLSGSQSIDFWILLRWWSIATQSMIERVQLWLEILAQCIHHLVRQRISHNNLMKSWLMLSAKKDILIRYLSFLLNFISYVIN